MRLILAKMVWNFDLKLAPQSHDWMDQRVFTLWEKEALKVQLVPVVRE